MFHAAPSTTIMPAAGTLPAAVKYDGLARCEEATACTARRRLGCGKEDTAGKTPCRVLRARSVLDLDPARRGFGLLRDDDLEHAMLAGRADVLRIGAVRQRKTAIEHAVRPLDPSDFAVLGLPFR